MVYKNFEKNYKTYRTTWSNEAISVVPELDPVARASHALASTTAKAASPAAAVVAAAVAATKQQRLLQVHCHQHRGLRPRQRTTPKAETILEESNKRR